MSKESEYKEFWESVMGYYPPKIEDAFTEETTRLFTDIWTRPGLDRAQRRLVTLTVTAMTASTSALEHHMKAALEKGDLTEEQAREWVVHLAYYAGWPIGVSAYSVLMGILD